MPSKMSWFNKQLFLQNIRTTGWISIIYSIILLFAIPLKMFMDATNEYIEFTKIDNLFRVNSGLQVLLLAVIPVLLGIFLFRYLQLKSSADWIHSLPLKRKQLYHNQMVTGLLFLSIPVVITFLITLIIVTMLDLSTFVPLVVLLKWLVTTLVFNVLLFTLTVTIGMLTGISALQAVLSYIFLLFPAGAVLLFSYTVPTYLYGFAYDYYAAKNIDRLSPLLEITILPVNREYFSSGILLFHLGLAMDFYLLANYLYKHRKIEAATQAIIFTKLRPVFKYGVTFFFMLTSGLYFSSSQNEQFAWTLFGYFVGSLIGYFLAEMVLQKTWRVFKHIKGYGGYAAIIVLLIIGFQFDMTGFASKVPAVNQIKQVHFSSGAYTYQNKEDSARYNLSDSNTIEAIRTLHKQLTLDQPVKSQQGRRIFLAYELQNGKKVIRQYTLPDQVTYDSYLKPIYESTQYKQAVNDIFHITKPIDKLSVTAFGINRTATIVDPNEIKQAINILKQDVLNETYEDMAGESYQWGQWGQIDLLLANNERVYLPWKKSYHLLDEWLANKEKGQVRVNTNDIAYALVIKDKKFSVDRAAEEILLKMEEDPNTLKIEAKDQINAVLKQSTNNQDEKYVVAFVYKQNNFIELQGFNDKTVPSFVKQHFE